MSNQIKSISFKISFVFILSVVIQFILTKCKILFRLIETEQQLSIQRKSFESNQSKANKIVAEKEIDATVSRQNMKHTL